MKKVLSVLLAAAMVAGMSVASFADEADKTFGAGSTDVDHNADVTTLEFNWCWNEGEYFFFDEDVTDLEEGDELYFRVDGPAGTAFLNDADKDWSIKINNAKYVDDAEFFYDDGTTTKIEANKLFVKVTLEDDFDHYLEDEIKFYFYIYDSEAKASSDKVKVSYDFANYATATLTAEKLDWVVTVNRPTKYTYAKNEKAKVATIDFEDIAYAEFKMYAEEKYTLSADVKYNKTLSKEYDTDVEVISFRLINAENVDILFPAAKDNKQIVAVVDGELVPVESTYVEDHKFQSGEKADGYLVEDVEYLTYAVIDASVEIEVEAEEPVEAPVVEAEKANPETGAADFVGAAVAMAVVSVAAAGALALKK